MEAEQRRRNINRAQSQPGPQSQRQPVLGPYHKAGQSIVAFCYFRVCMGTGSGAFTEQSMVWAEPQKE